MQRRIGLIPRLTSIVLVLMQTGEVRRKSFSTQTMQQVIATLNQTGQIKAIAALQAF